MLQDSNAAAGKFGFAVDNTIGGTPQPNGWMDSWVDFFRERRLRHQLQLAGDRGLSQMGEVLMNKLEVFFEGVEVSEKPSVRKWRSASDGLARAGQDTGGLMGWMAWIAEALFEGVEASEDGRR